MDLTLLIVLIIFTFMIYYLIASIQSLLQEIKEVKMKCITTKNANVEDTIEIDYKDYFHCSNNQLLFKVMKIDNSITLKHIWNNSLNKNRYVKNNMMSYTYHNELNNNYSLTFDNQTLKLYNLDFLKASVNCQKIEKSEYENYGLNMKIN